MKPTITTASTVGPAVRSAVQSISRNQSSPVAAFTRQLQQEAAAKKGFQLVNHDHRLLGYCRSCSKKVAASKRAGQGSAGPR